MSRKRSPNSYGFTTTPDDSFLRRVAREAKPTDGYFVTQVRNSFGKDHKVIVMMRQEIIPPAKAGLKVAGKTLGRKVWGRPVSGFKFVEVATSNPKKTANALKNEVHRVQNFLAGRHIQVLVEAI